MALTQEQLARYWSDIPIGFNAPPVTYDALCIRWNKNRRKVREILHELSTYDNDDGLVLIRSAHGRGFYKTTDLFLIERYSRELLAKAKSILAPLKSSGACAFATQNNLKWVRVSLNMKQSEVVNALHSRGEYNIDKPMLSKMENSVCLPNSYQLSLLADIYGCKRGDLLTVIYL